MSVRRRAIKARVERDRKWDQQNKEMTAELDLLQQTLDSFKAEGRTKVDQWEFAARLDALRPAVSEYEHRT